MEHVFWTVLRVVTILVDYLDQFKILQAVRVDKRINLKYFMARDFWTVWRVGGHNLVHYLDQFKIFQTIKVE